jgi:hypothetical protein
MSVLDIPRWSVKKWIGAIALAASGFLFVSCGSQSNPLTPGSFGFSYASPEILAAIAMQGGTANAASVELMTDTQAVTNATVTLTGPAALSLPLTLSSSGGSSGNYYAYYNSTTGWNYQANQSYTMTISYSGHTFQSTITTPGNVVFSPSSSGLTVTWAGGGNENTITAFGGSPTYNYTYGPNVTSPHTVLKSGLMGYSAGNYTITLHAIQALTSTFSGSYTGSTFTASDQETTTY